MVKKNSFFKKEKKAAFIGIVCLVVVLLDQITKWIVTSNITKPISVIGKVFNLVFVKNTGAGFGILKGQQLFLIFVSIFAIGLILFYYNKIPKNKWVWLFFGLLLGGTIGNLIDRLFFGYVVDFLDFVIWPAFNVADSAITVGAIGLVIWMMKDGRR